MAATDRLTIKQVENAKAKERPYKLADGEGMYLLVKPDGGRYWRFKYRYAGREKLLSLGVFPDTGLKLARDKRQRAREQLAAGVDPSEARQQEKEAKRQAAENTFEAVAREWIEKRGGKWSAAHRSAVERRLETDLNPFIGSKPIASITSERLLEVLRKAEARGAHEIAHKARTIAGQVFRYAKVAGGRVSHDPTVDLRGALEVVEKRHYARLKAEDLPGFLTKLDAYDGEEATKLAMKLLVLTAVRTAELRAAEWKEFDVQKRQWLIPAEKMKAREAHIVPLSNQALECLEQLRGLTGKGKLLFPNEHDAKRPMSENTILYALYRMGYRGRATGHGFRATFSTIANEQERFKPDAIERQLAHKERNKVRAAYHHTDYLPERRKLMQWWADFLDAKRKESNVIPLHARATQ